MDPNQTFESGNMSRPSTPYNSGSMGSRTTDPMMSQTTGTDHHSIGHAMQDLFRDMSLLIEREGQLLRTELSEKATIVKASGISLASAMTLAFFGVQALVVAAIVGLGYAMDLWLAAAIVGVALLAVGAVLGMKAKKALNVENLKPKKSTDALSNIGVKLKEKAHEFYH